MNDVIIPKNFKTGIISYKPFRESSFFGIKIDPKPHKFVFDSVWFDRNKEGVFFRKQIVIVDYYDNPKEIYVEHVNIFRGIFGKPKKIFYNFEEFTKTGRAIFDAKYVLRLPKNEREELSTLRKQEVLQIEELSNYVMGNYPYKTHLYKMR